MRCTPPVSTKPMEDRIQRPEHAKNSNELVAHHFARQLSARHRVDDDIYRKAKQAFGEEGMVDMVYLIGIYLVTCALLNGFEIPAPISAASEGGTQTSSSKQWN